MTNEDVIPLSPSMSSYLVFYGRPSFHSGCIGFQYLTTLYSPDHNMVQYSGCVQSG